MPVYMLNLGCARNQVDSEVMRGRLEQAGYPFAEGPEAADVIIVNTCSFIESATEESIDAILEMAAHKTRGRCKRLIVAGCLPERYRQDMVRALPEVDVFLGTGAFDRILDAVRGVAETRSGCLLPDPDSIRPQSGEAPRALVNPHSAYLKIAEGCDRHCTYCIIPKLRGHQKSRPPAAILAEARRLVHSGVRELVLVAQDTTHYGCDLSPPTDLAALLQELAPLAGNTWIRLLYGHPESLATAVIKTIASHGNICSYLDIPIQHASDEVLRRMGRRYVGKDLRLLFDRIRSTIPDVALRTTLIVGFPGETDSDFAILMDFIQAVCFNHVGVFTYSDAADLTSHRLPDHVAPAVAKRRRDRLMRRQQEISRRINAGFIGQTLPVLIEEQPEPGLLVGRTPFQAPEVDGVTYVHLPAQAPEPPPGAIVTVCITDAMEYDLVGKPV
jgi:ribosomal protein S12 methylthiotransferase